MLGLVVVAVSSWRSVSAPLLEQLRRASSTRSARQRAVAIDVAAGTVAVAALYETSRDTTDLLTLTGPGILAFAVGLLLFVITLVVNMIARAIVARYKEFSGAN